ncbi:MAG TPA: septal ring lytic transglycosylase RlpA family protein [Methyloceanibacter sp.]|nr:septal ring lytic transglycosylase RlpA family protein [Methyloceanibacter sp.]
MRGVAGVRPLSLRCLREVHGSTWAASLAVVAVSVAGSLAIAERIVASSEAPAPHLVTLAPAPRIALPVALPHQVSNHAKTQAREPIRAASHAALVPDDDWQKPESWLPLAPEREAPQAAPERAAEEGLAGETGRASWYALASATASGEAMDARALTAAHPTLPFGSYARVENLDNGRSVLVRINDRGPFAKGRIIDVSKAAAAELGMIRAGVAKVRVSPAGEDVAGTDDMQSAAAEP